MLIFKIIDDFLNKITTYRLVLYVLIILVAVASTFNILGILHYNPVFFLASLGLLLTACWGTNKFFSYLFKAPTNIESVYITALIIFLIMGPSQSLNDFIFVTLAGIIAMASKYILAIGKKHIFNPAAVAAVITAIGFNQYATWWIGDYHMLVFVLIGGLLIVRKVQKVQMVLTFFAVFAVVLFTKAVTQGDTASLPVLFNSSLLFFAFIMLTEPLTSPTTKNLQIIYAALAGALLGLNLHFGTLYLTAELCLVMGNLFSYLTGPREKLILQIKEKTEIAPNIYDYIFKPEKKLNYLPGQYMEWTLSHKKPDSRGNRRYFTLASSPTEDSLRLGVRFYDNSSSFKKFLRSMENDKKIVASQLSGNFTLPKNKDQKLVFIAGGIGITPFRSIIKYLIDKKEKRDIVLFYANKSKEEIVYRDVLDRGEEIGVKTIYVISRETTSPQMDKLGRVDSKMIQDEVPDFKDRSFYLSGPRSMVLSFEETLNEMGVGKTNIKSDFFPGYT